MSLIKDFTCTGRLRKRKLCFPLIIICYEEQHRSLKGKSVLSVFNRKHEPENQALEYVEYM